jgi:hypothetical protein
MRMDAKANARRQATVALAATILAATTLTGCSGARSSPRAVSVALTAPTDGAVVNESRIKVFGTVEPSSARVDIAGKRVHVAQGRFARWVTLRRGLSHIRIVATAAGHVPNKMDISVTSSPRASTTHASTSAQPATRAPVPIPATGAPAGSQYAPSTRATYLRTCKAAAGGTSATDAKCECALSYLEARVPERTLAASEREVLAGRATLPSWYREAALACRAA